MSGIGVNLRVTGHCSQGGRKYMEDMFSVAYQQTEDLNDLEYAFFGIFDGHGGAEAATYAKEHLLNSIVQQKSFWSDNDIDVLRAIHDGYIATHQAMWKEQANWQRTQLGLPSTSGTTATVAFIMKGKIYIGHVGDTMLVLGYYDEKDGMWKCKELTKDHKPENPEEIARITKAGGKVVRKNGVPRVVWNRPKIGHKGPVRRSTPFDEIPFLAVARSLGDFWSYNAELDTFVVSPEPDVGVIEMDTTLHKCLIFGTDGLWNMLTPQSAVDTVHFTEIMNNKSAPDSKSKKWVNPSKNLVDKAIAKWTASRSRADNTSVVTLMIDPPGPPPRTKAAKLDRSKLESSKNCHDGVGAGDSSPCDADDCIDDDDEPKLPESGGMAIFTRLPNEPDQEPTPTSPSICLNSKVMSKIRPCLHHSTKESNSHSQQKPISSSTSSCNTTTTTCSDFRLSTLRPISHFESDLSTVSDSQVSTTSPSPTPSRSLNNSPSLTPTASKRKRFRLDEKRSSLPLNMMGPEESSGNSDTENERVSFSPEPSSPSPNSSKMNVKKQKVEIDRKHVHNMSSLLHHDPPSVSGNAASSSTPSVVQNTRTLRSDTLASIPIKTLRSRNVNMSSNVNVNSSPNIYHQNTQYYQPRRQSATTHPTPTTSNNTNNSSSTSNNKKWSQRR